MQLLREQDFDLTDSFCNGPNAGEKMSVLPMRSLWVEQNLTAEGYLKLNSTAEMTYIQVR